MSSEQGNVTYTDNEMKPLEVTLQLLAAVHEGQDLQPILDSFPSERHGELFLVTLVVAYTAVQAFCEISKIDITEFFDESETVLPGMRGDR